MIKLALVKAYLSLNGWRCTVEIKEFKDTGKTYSRPGRRIHKSNLLEVDTILIQSTRYFDAFTYCKLLDIEKAKELVLNKVLESVTKAHSETSTCYTHSKSDPKWTDFVAEELPPSGELIL